MQIQQEISSTPIQKFTPGVKSKAATTESDSDDEEDDHDVQGLRGTEVPCNGNQKVIVSRDLGGVWYSDIKGPHCTGEQKIV